MSEQDMIEIGGVMRPTTQEKAQELAKAQKAPILAAREKLWEAERELLEVCIRQYPVGSRVDVNIAARRSPMHEVTAINENGWMTLRNCFTGTERGLKADSVYISPTESWWSREIRELK